MSARLPVDKADVSGASAKNPQRHKNRTKPKGVRPIGEPYKAMNDAECGYWEEFKLNMPWLTSSDRVLLRLTCKLAAEMDGGEFGVSKSQALSSCLSKLGGTPTDISKINHGTGEDDDPDDEFFH